MGLRRNAIGFGGGVEILGAGEEASLQTRLATLHTFQGVADLDRVWAAAPFKF